jgi:protein-S-isoprenylcysteine O-methyltransferase Ste14
MKPAPLAATFLLAAVSLAHLLRLAFGIPVTVADSVIPMWVSGIACLVAGAAAFMLWRSARRKG